LLKAVKANTRKRSPEPEDERLGIFLGDIQEQLDVVREQLLKDSSIEEAFLQALDSAREPILDTLIKYGDLMHFVKPEEYINLVFQVSPMALLNASRRGTEVISVRKSWITDYNAGRITRDEFRKKVPQ
jgi:hypothetical protein